jgi:hypothetical protein
VAHLRTLISSSTHTAILRVLALNREGAIHTSELIGRMGFPHEARKRN